MNVDVLTATVLGTFMIISWIQVCDVLEVM